MFSSQRIRNAMLFSRKPSSLLLKHHENTLVKAAFSTLAAQSLDHSVEGNSLFAAAAVVLAMSTVFGLEWTAQSPTGSTTKCESANGLRDPMTSYAIHSMVREMKREADEKRSILVQQHQQKQDNDEQCRKKIGSNEMLASSSASTSSITAKVSTDNVHNKVSPQFENTLPLSSTNRQRQRFVSNGGIVDPMTSYAVNAMVRKIKREKEAVAEETNQTMNQEEQQDRLSTKPHTNNNGNSKDRTISVDNIDDNDDIKLTLIKKRISNTDDTENMIRIISTSSMSEGNIPGVHGVDLTPDDDGTKSTTTTSSVDQVTSKDLAGEMMTLAEAKIEEATRKAKQHSGGLKIFSGNGNMSLALEICRHLGVNLGKATVGRFADGEVNVVIHENVRGKDVYVVQPTGPPVNDNMMELLLMVSTLRRSSARRITVVIPYYGYARQDRKMQARVPISAADVARLMEAMGIDRVIAVDLHCGQIQGFFGPRVPVDNLDGGIVGLDYFGCKDLHNPVIVSPDAGGVYRAKNFKDGLEQKYEMHDLALAVIVKQRAKAGVVDQMDLVGDVRDCDCIIVDDMIDTAGTLVKAADVLIANGARRVFAFASHGLLSGPGNERIANSQLEEVVILNTLATSPQREANEKLTQLSVAPLLAQAIFNIHAKKSISALFK